MTAVLSCREILDATSGALRRGDIERIFHGVSTDSREAVKDTLFIPIEGERFDGHDFLLPAVRNGAVGLLIREGKEEKGKGVPQDITVIRVPDTLRALGDIAHRWRRKFDVPVVAITGSSGKTTTKEMVATVAGLTKRVLKTQGTRNNLVGLPQTLLELDEGHDIAVVELGTNRPGEIGRLAAIALPNIGLVTNIGPAHMEGLGSLDAIREEKGDLYRFMVETGVAIINLDDDAAAILGRRWQGAKVTFGIRRPADVTAEGIGKVGETGTAFVLKAGGRTEKVSLQAAGRHNVANALAAAAVTWALGCELGVICRGLSSFTPVAGRMEIRRLANGALLIDDTYNANPSSTGEAIKTLDELREKGGSIVILGDMLELGAGAEDMHAEIGALLAASGVNAVFLKGQYAEATAEGAIKAGMSRDRIHFFESAQDILAYLRGCLKKSDWILIKGSRKARMEEITEAVINAFGLTPGSDPM